MTIDYENCSEVIDFAARLLAIADVIAMDMSMSNDDVLTQIIEAARVKHGEEIAALCREIF